jgi:hypothetical protein
MGAGGVIQDDVETLSGALHSAPSNFYGRLKPAEKAKVDAIDGKDPLSHTKADVVALAHALLEAAKI